MFGPNFRALLLTFAIFQAGLSHAISSPNCTEWNQGFKSNAAPIDSSSPSSLEPLFAARPRITWMGEFHSMPVNARLEPLVLKAWASRHAGQKRCFFVELSSDHQNDLSSGGTPQSLAERMAKTALGPNSPDVQDLAAILLDWAELMTSARTHGVSVHTFDLDYSTKRALESDPRRRFAARNRAMTEAIRDKLESEECDVALALNGASHLMSEPSDGSFESLPSALREYSQQAILILSTYQVPETLAPAGCAGQTKALDSSLDYWISGPLSSDAALFPEFRVTEQEDLGPLEPLSLPDGFGILSGRGAGI